MFRNTADPVNASIVQKQDVTVAHAERLSSA
jgi:hypothetical protein